ncbi:sensor histidine kinase [Sediminicola luteus]|uniref:Signal transduction histidine kinase internal region domain-containing protein n=1 Tax=Sediminicola luteus TaxID=319238 RepID=A0A2A4GEP2_9FLAO|nr:histidine kinase [Sediminicola luteus]PCE66446.1 hypothetical protein B7P33_03890 [Sediminicola luteus]
MPLRSALFSQILIHCLFWALFVFISLFVFSDFYWRANPFLHYLVILVAIVYANNHFLLPYFVQRKLYFPYALLFGGIAFFATQAYCQFFAQCGCTILKCLSDYLWQTLFPLVFFSFLWILERYWQQQETLKQVRQEHTAMELQLLKSQLDPHVLFNNLNTVYAYALEKPQDVAPLILKLSDNLKHMIYGSTEPWVPLDHEMAYLDNYIAFQRIRTENIIAIDYTTTIASNAFKIAPLLLIAPVENAFKHAAPHTSILIHIDLHGNRLVLKCRNKIKEAPSATKGTGTGLKNLRKRLELIYPNAHSLEIVENAYFEINLSVKLQ